MGTGQAGRAQTMELGEVSQPEEREVLLVHGFAETIYQIVRHLLPPPLRQ